jgi:uncharacterized protein YcnI
VIRKQGFAVLASAVLAALAVTGSAWAHAEMSPRVALAKETQLFTLAVPTEKEGLATTRVELVPPQGFSIDSFAPSPGWTRHVQQSGSGENAVIERVTWFGGHVPTGEDAFFQFLGTADASKTYTFNVRQTYSDGSVVDWNGPESSDTPAPVIEAKSSLGGGGGSSTLDVLAVILATLALVVAGITLFTRGGGRAVA